MSGKSQGILKLRIRGNPVLLPSSEIVKIALTLFHSLTLTMSVHPHQMK